MEQLTNKQCIVDNCDRSFSSAEPHHGVPRLRMCRVHAWRYHKHGDVQAHKPIKKGGWNAHNEICKVDGCGDKVRGLVDGYCHFHRDRYLKHGDPLVSVPKRERSPDGHWHGKTCLVKGKYDECTSGGKIYSLGYCRKHYKRLKQHGSFEKHVWKNTEACSVAGCDGSHYASSSGQVLCDTHHQRWSNNGTVDLVATSGLRPDEEALVYLLTDRLGSVKVGIAKKHRTKGSRIEQHGLNGWHLFRLWDNLTVNDARSIEKQILNWWRNDLRAPITKTSKEMGRTGGWTETAPTRKVGLRRTADRIDGLVKIKK